MKRESRRKRRRRVIRNRIIAISALVIIIALIVVIVSLLVKNAKKDNNKPTEPTKTESVTTDKPQDDTTETPAGNPDDVTAPVIRGEANIYVAKGAKVKYKSYIFVEDDYDPSPKIEIDNSDVDLSKEGTYVVIYTVTDASGNSASKEVNVVVGAAEQPNVDEKEIYALADEVISNIITNDMTDLEKVFAVYNYVTTNFEYVKDDNYWEYKQEAYHMMKNLQDNCYANVCVSKLLFERMGFDSFMIQGEMGYVDEHHYWNMVSLDGGQTWYHYDSAWWNWMYDEYPLVMLTDEQAMTISDRHGGIFMYDEDAFPKTPEEPLYDPEELGYYTIY